jgi:predicted nucleic acid-binding protein
VIVVDGSAALAALLASGPGRRALADEKLHAPYLIDIEMAGGLRRSVHAQRLSADAGWAALHVFRRLGMTRHPGTGLLRRVWDLRANLSAYDACYVALAETFQCDSAYRQTGASAGQRPQVCSHGRSRLASGVPSQPLPRRKPGAAGAR